MHEYTIPCFFAAANSYFGFKNYFGSVFDSSGFDRIYVIKGGPGTGKSSLMKKFDSAIQKAGGKTEKILCSSDPKSLDGVIAYGDEAKIALLDGTAPHERDAVIAGAVDELVNLGDGWDSRFLAVQKEKILSLTDEKKKAYERAYFYLSVAGSCMKWLDDYNSRNIQRENAIYKIKSAADSAIKPGGRRIIQRMIRSFGRFGSYRLKSFDSLAKETVRIAYANGIGYLCTEIIRDILAQSSADAFYSPSPLNPAQIDEIYLPETGVLFTVEDGECDIDCRKFVFARKSDTEGQKRALQIYGDCMTESQRWFSIASDTHFELEEIYSAAMNFDKNEEITEKIIANSLDILKISG